MEKTVNTFSQQPIIYQAPIYHGAEIAQYAERVQINTAATLAIKNIDAANHAALEYQHFQNQLTLKQREADINLKKLQTIEKNRRARELSVECLIEDSDGKLCLEITTPDGMRILSKPIIGVSGIVCEILYAEGIKEKVLKISWCGCENPVYVRYDCSTKSFAKAIRSAGLVLKAPRDRVVEITKRLHIFFLSRAKRVEIAKSFGWNKFSDDSWRFCFGNELCLEAILNEI